MTPSGLIQTIPDAELRQMVREVLSWQKTGVLAGDALRGLADRLVKEVGMNEEYALQHAESLTLAEASRRFAGQ